jgi:archaellum component FlaC
MKKKDSDVERLEAENKRLRTQVNSYKKEVKKLRSEIKTTEKAWGETEDFLKNITAGRSLKEVIKDAASGNGLKKLENVCRNCQSPDVAILKYPSFRILVCAKCGLKLKIEEVYSDE